MSQVKLPRKKKSVVRKEAEDKKAFIEFLVVFVIIALIIMFLLIGLAFANSIG